MLSLHEFQADFARNVFRGNQPPGMDVSPAERLAIYRNNVFSNFREALSDVYPVVARLVGDGFLRYAADRFIRMTPSLSGDLHRFGEEFPDFLREFPAAAKLPYLPDTARLEWLIHEAFHAAEHPPFRCQRLGEVAEDDWRGLTFRLHPACRLFASPYPVHRIWEANQLRSEETVDLGSGECRLLVRRQVSFQVEITPLDPGEFALLSGLAVRQCLGEVVQSTAAGDPDFDVAAAITKHVLEGTIVDFGRRGD